MLQILCNAHGLTTIAYSTSWLCDYFLCMSCKLLSYCNVNFCVMPMVLQYKLSVWFTVYIYMCMSWKLLSYCNVQCLKRAIAFRDQEGTALIKLAKWASLTCAFHTGVCTSCFNITCVYHHSNFCVHSSPCAMTTSPLHFGMCVSLIPPVLFLSAMLSHLYEVRVYFRQTIIQYATCLGFWKTARAVSKIRR